MPTGGLALLNSFSNYPPFYWPSISYVHFTIVKRENDTKYPWSHSFIVVEQLRVVMCGIIWYIVLGIYLHTAITYVGMRFFGLPCTHWHMHVRAECIYVCALVRSCYANIEEICAKENSNWNAYSWCAYAAILENKRNYKWTPVA